MERLRLELESLEIEEKEAKKVLNLMRIISEETKYSYNDLATKNRKREKVALRHMSFNILSIYSKITLKKIGALFGGRDHSTVIHGKEKHLDDVETNEDYLNLYSKLKKRFIMESLKDTKDINANVFDDDIVKHKAFEVHESINNAIKKLEELNNLISKEL